MIMTGVYAAAFGIGLYLLIKGRLEKKSALIMIVGSLIAFCLEILFLASQDDLLLSEVLREEKTGIKKTVEVEARLGEERKTILLQVFPQKYSDRELKELCDRMWAELEEKLIGGNSSLDYVTEDLFFPERVEPYPFVIRWESSERELLTSRGQIGEQIPKEGKLVQIQAHIKEEGGKFEEERVFYAELFPSQDKEKFWRRLEQRLTQIEAESRSQSSYFLPERFEGKEIQFYEKKNSKSRAVFLLAVIASAFLYVHQRQEQNKREKERAADMEREYPKMVSRITMLIGAGMTISAAFRKIAADYERKRQEGKNPLYEEFLITCREMEAGISERVAYQNMGIRCGLPCVVRFTGLLAQHMKSGAGGLKKALQDETDQALKDRRERARRLGEEAGTKLLFPMILMLILIMLIITIPAFTSFGV